MRNVTEIIRQRRGRRANQRAARQQNTIRTGIGVASILSIFIILAIIFGGLAYADLTRDLPSIESLPVLFNPQRGTLLQPSRFYDRTGQHLIAELNPLGDVRKFISVNENAGAHFPKALTQALIATFDPQFNLHAGYVVEGWNEAELHPTFAQKLVSDFLIWDEPLSVRRALRERILAAQITSRYGRAQILEWFLNSANFGHYAYGAESAAQLYFGKPASQITLAEAAILAGVAEAPALNPFDAPDAARQRGQNVLTMMLESGAWDAFEISMAQSEEIIFQDPALVYNLAPQFVETTLAQLDAQGAKFPRTRLERGGINITTTMDYEAQLQIDCAVETLRKQLINDASETRAADGAECIAAQTLPVIPPGLTAQNVKASAVLIDPQSGELLAVTGDALQGNPGTLLTPFIYLSGFTRGLGPASLTWDIPNENGIQNLDGQYHGPVRLRIALANDYLSPLAQVFDQTGAQSVLQTARAFGLPLEFKNNAAEFLNNQSPLSIIKIARAYGVFATQGALNGEDEHPRAVLQIETSDHRILFQAREIESEHLLSPQLAYLMNHILEDDSARWQSLGRPSPLDITRPAAAKLGQTANADETWTAGYTPQRVLVVHFSGADIPARVVAGAWAGIMRYTSRALPPLGWEIPAGVSRVDVCDPSGLLPTADCPNIVKEIFLNGNEPIQADNLFRAYEVNRESGLLATIFTPLDLIEKKVFLLAPPSAKAWIASAGYSSPPETYDTIQIPPTNPNVNITSPAMFATLGGKILINGTAQGENFLFYRLQYGQGLNPQTWIQIGTNVTTPVTDNLLAEWDTSGLNGLYAIQLQVVHIDQTIETVTIQIMIEE